MAWITENFCSFLTDLISSIIDSFGTFINNIFFTVVAFADTNAYYQNAQKLFVLVGFSLAGLMTAKVVASGYLMETAYDPEEDPFNLLVRIAQTTAVISCSGWIFSYGLQVSRDLCTDLLGATDVTGFDGKTRELLQFANMGEGGVSFIVMLLILLIAFIVFTVMSGLRAGELLVMNLFLPVFSVDLLTNSRERWNNFFTGYIFAFVSYAIQTLFFMIAMKSYLTATYTNQIYMMSALIWMIVAIRAPKFIEKYLYQTGVSSAASSGFRMVAQTVVMRTAMR